MIFRAEEYEGKGTDFTWKMWGRKRQVEVAENVKVAQPITRRGWMDVGSAVAGGRGLIPAISLPGLITLYTYSEECCNIK